MLIDKRAAIWIFADTHFVISIIILNILSTHWIFLQNKFRPPPVYAPDILNPEYQSLTVWNSHLYYYYYNWLGNPGKQHDIAKRYIDFKKPSRYTPQCERCSVVGSTLAFGSIGRGFKSEQCLFSHLWHQPSANFDHWCSAHWTLFSSLAAHPAAVHSAIATLRGSRIEWQRTSGSSAELTQRSTTSFDYIQVVAFRSTI